MEELLPVGSVVELNNGTTLTIVGYSPSKYNDLEIYDYTALVKPYGFIKPVDKLEENKDYVLIKKEDIKRVKFIGYSDKEFDFYADVYNTVMSEVKKNREANITTQESWDEILVYVLDRLKKAGVIDSEE